MFKYRIRFKLDIEDALDYDEYDQKAEIIEVDDDCFIDMFNTNEKIKEFENSYNDAYDSDFEKINVIEIVYEKQYEDGGVLEVTLEDKLEDEKLFADELILYMFETDNPEVKYNVTGTTYEDYWNYSKSSPEQRTIRVDYDDYGTIYSYSDVEIEEIH